MNVGSEERYLCEEVQKLVTSLTYKPGYHFYIGYEVADDGAGGWHFFVRVDNEDSMNPGTPRPVRHGFLIPPASYNRNTWAAWLFDRILDVETHEAAEFFKLDGFREFAPHHSNGEDPYRVWHTGDYATARKSSGDD